MLELQNLDARYNFLQVLWDVNLRVEEGEFVALVGPNGAGKTTTLRCIAGLLPPTRGRITFCGETISGMPAHRISRLGISLISEQLNLFTNMTIEENLLIGGYAVADRSKLAGRLEMAWEIFPRLLERRNQLAGTLSGGERKMLAIGRGLMSSPRLLLVDEPSLGLAPLTTGQVFDALVRLNKEGVTILLVEQNVTQSLCMAGRGYVIEQGRIVLEGTGSELLANQHVRHVFLGA